MSAPTLVLRPASAAWHLAAPAAPLPHTARRRGRLRSVVLFGAAVALVLVLRGTPWAVDRSPACHFALGFAQLRAQLGPAAVGFCLADESFDPSVGEAIQPTVRGLLVWRKADGGTAFSDGHRTWVTGPFGLQQRLNGERFCWEAGAVRGRCLGVADGGDAGPALPADREIAQLATALAETIARRAGTEWASAWDRATLWLARALTA